MDSAEKAVMRAGTRFYALLFVATANNPPVAKVRSIGAKGRKIASLF